MEGHLTLIRTSLVGTSQRRVWAVLDGQQLMTYASLDLSTQLPRALRGVFHVAGAEVGKAKSKTVPHGMTLVCAGAGELG
ncbi:hypothetical protein B484DRAFT_416489, partial [Ochromonadaceae sp. CCMP2298]